MVFNGYVMVSNGYILISLAELTILRVTMVMLWVASWLLKGGTAVLAKLEDRI
jgi:hypothetical protein